MTHRETEICMYVYIQCNTYKHKSEKAERIKIFTYFSCYFRLCSTRWNLLNLVVWCMIVGQCIWLYFLFVSVCFRSVILYRFVCFVSLRIECTDSGVFLQFVLKLWFLTSRDSIETLRSSVVCGARFCKVFHFCFFFSFFLFVFILLVVFVVFFFFPCFCSR